MNTTIEPESARLAPAGVTVHTARMMVHGDPGYLENIAKMAEGTELAVTQVAFAADAIAYACTAGSFAQGRQWDLALIGRIERTSGKPATTTARSLIEAARALGVSKIGVATPYLPKMNEQMAGYLEESGLRVTNMKGLGLYKPGEPAAVTPHTLYRLARDTYTRECECLLLSCTDMPTFQVIEPLEADLGVPIITSNQTTLWQLLRLASVDERITGFGRLLQLPARATAASLVQ